MQLSSKASTATAARAATGVRSGSARLACRPIQPRLRTAAQAIQQRQQQQQLSAPGAAADGLQPLSLAAASLLWTAAQQPLAAWADESAEGAVQQAAASAADAAAEAGTGPTWLSYVVVATPILLYGIFNVYRDRVNPRIKFSDFLFVVAGVAVVANLVAIVAFKVRLF